jgi:hypothetical protein
VSLLSDLRHNFSIEIQRKSDPVDACDWRGIAWHAQGDSTRKNILANSVRLFTDMFLLSAQHDFTVRSLKLMRRRQAHQTCRTGTARVFRHTIAQSKVKRIRSFAALSLASCSIEKTIRLWRAFLNS